nr:hypothetical protein [Oscillochloris trichoides]
MPVDPLHVPEQFQHLIPLAETWGINDDGYRAAKLKAASSQELSLLKEMVLPLTNALYLDWLGDTGQLDTDAEETYLAFTALVLAAEEAP